MPHIWRIEEIDELSDKMIPVCTRYDGLEDALCNVYDYDAESKY